MVDSVSLEWGRLEHGELRAAHGRAGQGPPLLFLHGWGVGPRSYAGALRHVAAAGCAVAAPAQPGFAGTPGLDADDRHFPGYARWAARYLDALGVDERVVVVGHSFGGGVALQFAHDHPERVRAVVLCNAVGGPHRHDTREHRPMADRPLWEWGRELGADLFGLSSVVRILPPVLEQAVPNFVQHPMAMWKVAEFVRRADLLPQAAQVAAMGIPLTVVWSDRDRLIPHAAFAALCEVAGVDGHVVPGFHSWMIADPIRFADLVWRASVEAGAVDHMLVRRPAIAL
ncbi:MAG TPA: alpha/beta fold hydrolase [Acidimicrobiales bacterium]|nr:alpha/beta fold hydrolase [Acidimicrobiales bacterium]